MSLKVLHTSDWHLGKKLFKKNRIPEQELFIKWLIEEITLQEIDILLMCGDIFDTPSPPNEAIALYFDFLNIVTEKTNCHIIIIPGNHDSASFIKAPLNILKRHNIHIICGIEDFKKNNHLSLTIKNQNLIIKALPYFRTYELYNAIEKPSNENVTKEDIKYFIENFFSYWPDHKDDSFRIIMAHHAFGSFISSESEQALILSGLDSIPESWIENNYHYMALGHIHKPQAVNKEKNIYYCGSPIPLRFSEVHNKKLNLIHINKDKYHLEKINIPVFRPIIQIKSNKENIKDKIDKKLKEHSNSNLSPFLELFVTMDSPDNEFNDFLYDYIREYGGILLSLIPVYSELINHEKTQQEIILNNFNIIELFKIYYKNKFPEIEHVPDKILQYFNENLMESSDEDHLFRD